MNNKKNAWKEEKLQVPGNIGIVPYQKNKRLGSRPFKMLQTILKMDNGPKDQALNPIACIDALYLSRKLGKGVANIGVCQRRGGTNNLK